MKTRTILAIAVASLLVCAMPARADFGRDAALVQQGQMTLEEAIGRAVTAGEDINAIVAVATGMGFDLVQLATALLNAGVDTATVQAALINANIDAATVGNVLVVAQAETLAAGATTSGTILGASGAGAGGGASAF